MKKIFFSLMAVCLLTLALPVAAQATATIAGPDGKLLYYNEAGVITGCDKSVNYALIPSEIDGVEITEIGNRAFDGCRVLVSVILPESITSIGDNAFDGCINLRDIYYHGSESMWEEINKNNNSFEDIPIYYQSEAIIPPPNLLYTLPDGNLLYYNVLGDITGCDWGVTDLVIPDEIDGVTITAIGDGAFSSHPNLTSIVIPEGVTSIGLRAFASCDNLTSVKMPRSITAIEDIAFSNCSNLASIEIPDGITDIGPLAFYGCSSLTSIEIPGSVTHIGMAAFQACSGLTSVIFSEGITVIGQQAFTDCSSLVSIEIPQGVTIIAPSVFDGCSGLTSVKIPDSVTRIGYCVFRDCPLLKDIYYAGSKSQWEEIAILESVGESVIPDNITIHYGREDPVDPDDSQPGKLPIETEPGSLGQEITVYVMGGYWITAQVRNGTAVAISAIQAPVTNSGEMTAVNFSAPKGSTIQIWVTEEKMTFTDGGAPNCKILYAVSTTL